MSTSSSSASAAETPEIVEADLTWTGEGFEAGVRVEIGTDGRIAAVRGPGAARRGPKPTRRLAGQALLPGFVNAHSHAFQRGLRGRGERFAPAGDSDGEPGEGEAVDDFWGWREAMYELADGFGVEELTRLCRLAFAEMRAAGITTIGEFHYLHHSGENGGYELDEAVLAAAADVGIRLVLLEAYYSTGAPGQPLTGAQRRFGSASVDDYWRQMDRLEKRIDPTTQRLGAAVHSLRAASPDELAAVGAEARRREMVLHLHVEEQLREIEQVRIAYGAPPMAILAQRLEPSEAITAVHCTHTRKADLEHFVAAGGNVCLCPLTEANLGDGIPDLSAIGGGNLCLGSDSNARISMFEEMRWAEYGQRLARRRRGVLRDAEGEVARPLIDAATRGGARALGIEAGAIEKGRWADLLAVDLEAPTLAGWDEETLAAALVFGAGDRVITATAIGGRWVEHRRKD